MRCFYIRSQLKRRLTRVRYITHKHNKKIPFSLFFLFFLVTSCEKKNDVVPTKRNNNTIETSTSSQNNIWSNYNQLTAGQIQEIGELHNSNLVNFITNYNFEDNNFHEQVNSLLEENIQGLNTIFPSGYQQAYNVLYNPREYINSNGTKHMKNFIIRMDSLVNNSHNYTDLIDQLTELTVEIQQDSNLTAYDKDFSYIYITVTSYSAGHWSSNANGGEGYYDSFSDNLSGNPPLSGARSKLENILIADGLAAAGSFLWIGLSGVWIVPPAWPVLCAEIGWACAWSSMCVFWAD